MQDTNESLGSYLKRTREERNISIEQVAYATRISLKMLRALEEDDHTALPAPTFVRGYLQAYAKYVRIDTQDLLLRYQHHLATAPDSKKNAIKSHYLYVRERYQEKRRLVLVIVLFITLLSVAGTYFMLKAKRERNKRLAHTAEQIEKIVEASPTATATTTSTGTSTSTSAATTPEAPKASAPAPEAPKAETTKPTSPEPAPASPKPAVADAKLSEPTPPPPVARPEEKKGEENRIYNLLLRAEEDVWLRYQTDSDEVRDLTLRTGKALMLRADKVIKIFSGNLGALKAKMNGQELDSMLTGNRSKSVVLPASEAANHPLPLFPQFQTTKTEGESTQGGDKKNPNTEQ